MAFTRGDQRGWRVSPQPLLVCRVGASDRPDPSPGLARTRAAFWGSTLKGPGGPMGPSGRHPTTPFREGKPGCGEKPAHPLPGGDHILASVLAGSRWFPEGVGRLPSQPPCLLGLLEGWGVLAGCWGPAPPCSSPSVRETPQTAWARTAADRNRDHSWTEIRWSGYLATSAEEPRHGKPGPRSPTCPRAGSCVCPSPELGPGHQRGSSQAEAAGLRPRGGS